MKSILYKYIIILCCSVNCLCSNAQTDILKTIPLRIDDRIPDVNLGTFLNAKSNPFPNSVIPKDRLLLIDFFTTYCGSCIASFPKLNALKKHNDRRIEIVLVSPEGRQRLSDFFATNAYAKDNALPIVIEDTQLSSLFPYRSVPHVAWIWNGKVVAITHSDMINQANIDLVLEGGNVGEWPVKNDFMTNENTVTTVEGISSQLGRYKEDSPTYYKIDTLDNEWVQYDMVNVTIPQAYLYAYSKIRTLPFMKKDRIVFDTENRERYENLTGIPQSQWMKEQAITYQAILPIDWSEKDRMAYILKDFNNKLRSDIKMEKRPVVVWVVSEGQRQKGELVHKGQKLSVALALFDMKDRTEPPIVNEVTQDRQVSITGYRDFEDLKKQLTAFGLKLTKEKRMIDVLVIKSNTAGD